MNLITENSYLALALAAGAILGCVFFGGLWWTVRKSLSSERAGLWFGLSFALRMGVTLLGFYLVGHNQPKALLACLLGFGLARSVVIRLTKRKQAAQHQEASVAP